MLLGYGGLINVEYRITFEEGTTFAMQLLTSLESVVFFRGQPFACGVNIVEIPEDDW